MTPPEWAGVVGAILAMGMLAERVSSRLAPSPPPPPPPRDAHNPPPPQPSLSAVCSESDRIDAVERRIEGEATRAQAFREQVIGDLAALRTMVAERTRRGGSPPQGGGDRGST